MMLYSQMRSFLSEKAKWANAVHLNSRGAAGVLLAMGTVMATFGSMFLGQRQLASFVDKEEMRASQQRVQDYAGSQPWMYFYYYVANNIILCRKDGWKINNPSGTDKRKCRFWNEVMQTDRKLYIPNRGRGGTQIYKKQQYSISGLFSEVTPKDNNVLRYRNDREANPLGYFGNYETHFEISVDLVNVRDENIQGLIQANKIKSISRQVGSLQLATSGSIVNEVVDPFNRDDDFVLVTVETFASKGTTDDRMKKQGAYDTCRDDAINAGKDPDTECPVKALVLLIEMMRVHWFAPKVYLPCKGL